MLNLARTIVSTSRAFGQTRQAKRFIHFCVDKSRGVPKQVVMNDLYKAILREQQSDKFGHVTTKHLGMSKEDLVLRVADTQVKKASSFVLANESRFSILYAQAMMYREFAKFLTPFIDDVILVASSQVSGPKRRRFIVRASVSASQTKYTRKGIILAKLPVSSTILGRYDASPVDLPLRSSVFIIDVIDQGLFYEIYIVTAYPTDL